MRKPRKRISQRQAREWRRERDLLLSKFQHGGVRIDTTRVTQMEKVAVDTAFRLGYLLVARVHNEDFIGLYAVKP